MKFRIEVHDQTCQAELPGPTGYRPCGRPAVTVAIPVTGGGRWPRIQIWRLCWECLADAAREEASDRPLTR
ncbi:MAG: hypothetical protein AAB254_06375 [candidate division NC10 bacterium]